MSAASVPLPGPPPTPCLPRSQPLAGRSRHATVIVQSSRPARRVATRPARRNAAGRSFSSLLEHDLFRNRYPLFGIMPYPTISLPEKNCPISTAAVAGASDPCTEFSPIDLACTLRIVPAAALAG